MNMPGFTAEASLYRTNWHYQHTAVLGAENGLVSPAVVKGTHCVVHDPRCPSGFSKLRCTSYDPDSCRETGICCTRRPPPPPPPPCPSGQERCTDRGVRGCCPAGTYCCNDDHGCCPDGWACRSICIPFLGCKHFCSPI
jgi:hypothetical protein